MQTNELLAAGKQEQISEAPLRVQQCWLQMCEGLIVSGEIETTQETRR